MPVYYCHLGNTPDLSLYELSVLLPNITVEQVLPTIAKLELENDAAARDLMNTAGGLVKIYKHLEVISAENKEAITGAIVSHLRASDENKVTFGLSTINISSDIIDTAEVKLALKQANIPSRYVDSEAPYGVAVAVMLKGKARELVILKTPTEVVLAETIAVQDINDWTNRDRSKPYFDRKKGMLHPKVARIMVNIGLGLLPPATNTESVTLYDPFCGTGTILMETMVRGVNVYGSDLDTVAVRGSRENIEWLKQAYDLTQTFQVVQRDVAQRFTVKNKTDLIVTEPFLGKPTPHEHELPNIFRGLERLYLGAFKNWTHILRDGAPVVIVFPLVETANHRYSLESLIDKLNDLGYTSVSQPIVYRRPQAITQRQIQFFRFNHR